MPIAQTEIRGRVRLPNNTPAQVTSVTFTLSASDEERDIFVAKHTISATIGEEGEFSIVVWPNEAGDRGNTRYRVTVNLAGGASLDPFPLLFVRMSDEPQELDDIVLEQTSLVAGYANRVLSQAQYDALTVYAPNTLYLVRL